MPSCNTYFLTYQAQPLLLTPTLEGYLLTTAPPDLESGNAPLGPPAPGQPPLLGGWFAPPGLHSWPRLGVAPLSRAKCAGRSCLR